MPVSVSWWDQWEPWIEAGASTYYDDQLGPLKLVTAPTTEPLLTTEQIKSHCRVEIDDDNALLALQVAAATELCQELVPGTCQFLSAVYDVDVKGFWSGPLRMPRPPLASLTSLQYYAETTGTLTTLAASNYLVRAYRKQPGTISRAPDVIWPGVQSDREFPLTLRFVAGYGGPAAVPARAKQAVLLVVGWYYQQREVGKQEFEAVDRILQTLEWGSYA